MDVTPEPHYRRWHPDPVRLPVFLGVLAVHVLAGLAAVSTGLVAMLSPKGRGRHSRVGTRYYWCLAVVFVSMALLSGMRWAEDYHLFVLGALSFTAATIGRAGRRAAGGRESAKTPAAAQSGSSVTSSWSFTTVPPGRKAEAGGACVPVGSGGDLA